MNELMEGDFYQTLITLILFDCILLLLVNLLRRKKQSKTEETSPPAPSPPKLVDINQYIRSSSLMDENPSIVNQIRKQTYEKLDSSITGKSKCYIPIKDGEQPYAAYKMNYFS
jgi:hypothetical protein